MLRILLRSFVPSHQLLAAVCSAQKRQTREALRDVAHHSFEERRQVADHPLYRLWFKQITVVIHRTSQPFTTLEECQSQLKLRRRCLSSRSASATAHRT